MPKQTTVQLGGREYVIGEKTMGVALKWREKLRQSSVIRVFESLDGALAQLVAAVNGLGEGGTTGQINLAAGVSLATIAPTVVRGLLNSIDEVVELLFDYSVEMRADREWILEHAYDEEAIAAFIEVLKLAYPITALWGLVRGSRVQPTAMNLPSPNGGSGRRKPTARSKAR